MSYENFDPNDLVIQSFSTKPEGSFGPHRIPHGVRAVHLPTGTVVTCDADRSQHRNRHNALTQLWEQVQGKPSYQELAAQVEGFKKIREDWRGLAINDAKTLIAFIEAADKAPQHHLRELRAEAGRAGFVAGYLLCNDGSALIKHNYEGFADKYAEQIRRGEVE